MAEVPIFRRAAAAAGALMMLSLAGAAAAQTLEANVSSYNAGWGRVPGQDNQPVSAGTRDANGNRVIIDGIMQTGVDQSSFSRADGGSWGSSGVGSQSGSSTAIGNNLVVITQGSWNTVIVDSHQTNNGNISADTSLNGGVSNVP